MGLLLVGREGSCGGKAGIVEREVRRVDEKVDLVWREEMEELEWRMNSKGGDLKNSKKKK